jgi:hypothetical protein
VGNSEKGTGRTASLLKRHDGKPEEPSAQGSKTLKLWLNPEGRAYFPSTLHEADELRDGLWVLFGVLEVGLDPLELAEGAGVSLKIFLMRLAWAMVRHGGWWSSRKCATLGNEVSELRFVLPSIHGLNDR